jgi:PKD domain
LPAIFRLPCDNEEPLKEKNMRKIFSITFPGLLALASAASGQTAFDPVKVKQGIAIAPVPLNMAGKDPNFVGYGSYLVNAAGDCNGCHSDGTTTQYAKGGNPYFGQSAVVNAATYLGGGRDFGAFPNATGNFPHIISRNLTPDYTGLGVGGDTFNQFLLIIRTGVDLDHVHPTCTGAPDGTCIPAPFDGSLLQVMSWPTFRNMTDDDLNAIYTYLSSIPCLEGGPGEPANRCTAPTQTKAVADPKNVTVVSGEISLDGSMSTSADGKPLTYQWTIPRGSPSAAILHGTLATPTAQFSQGRGLYTFLLTVTDSTGKSSSDLATVNFTGN